MDEKLICEKYLTEIAFTAKHTPFEDDSIEDGSIEDDTIEDNDQSDNTYHIVFWMAENFTGTAQHFTTQDIEIAVDLIILDNKNIAHLVLEKLKSKNISLFYSNEKHKDSNDMTLIVVGKNPKNTEKASINLNEIYTNDSELFFKILKTEGVKVR